MPAEVDQRDEPDEPDERDRGAMARLVAVDGPLAGRSFEIDGPVWRIGRHPDNELQVRQAGVSREHCRLCRRRDRWQVEDLGSRLGTLLNGLPAATEPLSPGDLLTVGESSFLFLLGPIARQAASSVVWNDREWAAESTVGFGQQDFKARLRGSLGEKSRLADELRALLDLASSSPEAGSPEALAEQALGHLAPAAPIRRAAVLWLDAGSDWQPLALWDPAGEAGELEVSRHLVDRAATHGTQWYRGRLDSAPASSQSLLALARGSAIAVPLAAHGEVAGMLYAEEAPPGPGFDEDHVRWLDAAGALLASGLATAHRHQSLKRENRRLADAAFDSRMVGESPAMRSLFAMLRRVAPSQSTVLIRGESGTGKELVARALHRNSRRSEGPFVPLNCATLSATLLESELFGHERGAFTGAVARRAGKLELAHGGTLFLDEVGEIPVDLQARLLRVLQEREFERVGGNKAIKVDVRLVAATNRDLEKAIAAGTFREDLYYRLDVISLSLPPLRRRAGDIGRLAEHFIARHAANQGRPGLRLSVAARRGLETYRWPGNVRELSNAIERAVVLAEGDGIELEDLPEALWEAGGETGGETAANRHEGPELGFHRGVAEAKKNLIRQALAESGGSFPEAARRLGLRRSYLHRLVSNLGLRPELESG